MREVDFIKRAWLVLSLALIAWLPSPVQADEQSMGAKSPSQKQEIEKDATTTDSTQEAISIHRETTRGELRKESEREMSVPSSGGPTPFDMEITREQEATASLAF